MRHSTSRTRVGGGRGSGEAKRSERGSPSKEKILNLHINFTFSLAARGSEERRMTARALEFFVTLN